MSDDEVGGIDGGDDILNVSKETSYWIYNVSKRLWNQYVKVTDSSEDDNLYVSSYDKSNLKMGDIIFYYIRDYQFSGFVGIARVSSLHQENIKRIKVFDDKNLNEHIVKLDYVTFFEEPIKISQIMNVIKDNEMAGHKNKESFRAKYMKKTAYFEKLSVHGYLLLRELINISDHQMGNNEESEKENHAINNDNDNDDSNDDNSQKNQYNILKKRGIDSPCSQDDILTSSESSNGSVKNDKPSKISVFVKKKLQKENIKIVEDDDNDDDNRITTPKSVKTSSSDVPDGSDDDDQDKEENKNDDDGEIPILVIPCNDFNWPSKKKDCKGYFIEHFKGCRNCEVTDNNSKQIGLILNDAVIDYHVSTKQKDAYFEIPIEYYDGLLMHDPMDREDDCKPFIRITRIENQHDIYDGCILLTWIC